MKEIIINAEQLEQKLFESSRFHRYRIAFNSAFLHEDFSTASSVCEELASLPELTINERCELASYCQMLGKIDSALKQLDLILQTNPAEHNAALQKARILRLHQDSEKYLSFIQSRMKDFPSFAPYYLDLWEFLRTNPDTELMTLIQNLAQENGIALPEEKEAFAPIPESYTPFSQVDVYSDSDLLSMINLFLGRENSYARQWVSDDGKYGYTPVNEPLNLNAVRNHLLGIQTLGIYQLDLMGKVKWIVFDLDVEKSHLDNLHDPAFRLWLEQGFQKIINEFRALLKTYHLEMNVEFSGYKGYHLWILLKEKIPAYIARNFAQRIVSQITFNGLPISIEIFPKQVRTSRDNYGNLVKLPYGIHRLSGLNSTMLNEDFKIVSFEEFIKQPKIVSPEDILSAIYSLDPNFSLMPEKELVEEPTPYSVTLETIEPIDPETDTEWLCLKQNCSVLWTLDNLINTNHSLTVNQKNVLRYVCGHLTNGLAIVNTLMKKLTNCELEDLMKRPFRGNAMSCNKIRKLAGDIIEPGHCHCDFSEEPGMYQTPLLHLKKLSSNSTNALQTNELMLKDLISTYLKLKSQSKDLEDHLKQIEKEIINAFDQIGLNEISTSYGILKKITDEDKISLVIQLK